jgi:hypothetical protein
MKEIITIMLFISFASTARAEALRDCTPNSIGPGGGQFLDRYRSKGLNPDTMEPY